MDLSDKWKIIQKSICLIQHFQNGDFLGSGTGFKIDGKIITNNHVYHNTESDSISISFVDSDCESVTMSKTYSSKEFQNLLITGDSKDNWDYAILTADSDFDLIPNLQLAKQFNLEVGKPVYFLGYPLAKKNLTINHATISSKYIRNGVKYIQLNANVNNGNSGGPLLDFENDLVIGLVTRKNTGLSKRFDQLKQSFAQNVQRIRNSEVVMRVGNIDPLQDLVTTQLQFDKLCDEIVRSSNVGIGYAFELDQINNDLEE